MCIAVGMRAFCSSEKDLCHVNEWAATLSVQISIVNLNTAVDARPYASNRS